MQTINKTYEADKWLRYPLLYSFKNQNQPLWWFIDGMIEHEAKITPTNTLYNMQKEHSLATQISDVDVCAILMKE